MAVAVAVMMVVFILAFKSYQSMHQNGCMEIARRESQLKRASLLVGTHLPHLQKCVCV